MLAYRQTNAHRQTDVLITILRHPPADEVINDSTQHTVNEVLTHIFR